MAFNPALVEAAKAVLGGGEGATARVRERAMQDALAALHEAAQLWRV